ncbi:hypothetical protein [Desulforamulus ruminis]|uniref:Bypass of forespore C C-terminal domain-containing protein n=1 Tax=Desulforamulus ruminis (strain ATCC 23193 / DSM 2154 / NCIMB 8452 / DL) TaxID=696281 RepID=F6DN41_DESRL|nr:hypothetical protein [Desulforamulus ruminis]AEG60630.1 hypothetical protein Desru_2388 [Desulforamulus ruminis DSM 2154]
MLKKILWMGLGALLVVALVTVFMVGGKMDAKDAQARWAILEVFAQQAGPALSPNIIIREENVYLCGDIEEVGRKTAGMAKLTTEKELKEYYGSRDFTLQINKDEIVAQKRVKDFCTYHKNFRHFGAYQDKLAVYQGPLGYNQKLLKVEESFPLNSLSEDFQVKLQQSMDFWHMTPKTQTNLRDELEFASEDAMNAVLENLDEMQE